MVFCTFLKQFSSMSSLQCLVQGDNVLSWVFQILGQLGNIAFIPEVGVGVGWGLFHKLERKVSLP